MDEQKLKILFAQKLLLIKKQGGTNLSAKAMVDVITAGNFVALFYKLGKKLFSLIVLEDLTKEESGKVAEVFNKLIEETKI